MTTYLSLEDLLSLTNDLEVGPVRDLGLLDSRRTDRKPSSSGTRPTRPWARRPLLLLESIVRNHPLVDGNERLGWLAAVVFYGLDDEVLEAPDDDAYDMVVAVASEQLDYQAAAGLLAGWPGVRLLRGE